MSDYGSFMDEFNRPVYEIKRVWLRVLATLVLSPFFFVFIFITKIIGALCETLNILYCFIEGKKPII